MEVVELTLESGVSVYVNPSRVATLVASTPDASGEITRIVFAADHVVLVRGDIDSIAFRLFPSGIR